MLTKIGTIALGLGLLLTLVQCVPGKSKGHSQTVVAFYNLENLFDTIDSPDVDDTEFTPLSEKVWGTERYNLKLDNMAKVIAAIGAETGDTFPAVVGLCEVENQWVLDDLVKHPTLKAANYKIVHKDSPDPRGIDVALLYRETKFSFEKASWHGIFLLDEESGDTILTRDQLLVEGHVHNNNINVLVNHWPSRWGGKERSEPWRVQSAQLLKSIADSLLAIDPQANIVALGDFNDDPQDRSMAEVLCGDGAMINLIAPLHNDSTGTLPYRGKWNAFDQVVVSKALTETGGLSADSVAIFKKDWMLVPDGKYKGYTLRTFVGDNYFGGFSDHLPVYVRIK